MKMFETKRGLAILALAGSVLFGCAMDAAPSGKDSTGTRVGKTSQALGETVTTNTSTYAVGDTVAVTFAGFPGNTYDWVAIAQDGSPLGSYLTYQFTYGAAGGTLNFTGLGPGTYVARGHENNGNTLLAASQVFTVTGGTTTISTDKATYTAAESTVVSYANMQGATRDWVSIANAGSAVTTYVAYQYTGGGFSGSKSFPLAGLPDGDYVARAYFNDSYTLAAESTVFHIGAAAVTTNKTTYAVNESITASWTALPGNQRDWIALAYADSGPNQYVNWVYTNGVTSGSYAFAAGLPAGTYVARAFVNDTFTIADESPPFQVGATASVTTDKASYTPAESAQVSFTNAPGSQDWIAIAPVGSPNGTYSTWQYTAGGASGMLSFSLTGLSGSYVARLFTNNTLTLLATSAPFSVGAAAATSVTPTATTYNFGAPVTINYAGMAGGTFDWIGISAPTAAPGMYIQWSYVYGQISGSHQFTGLPPGSYVARAYFDNGVAVKAESATFTVQGSTTCATDKTSYAAGEAVTVNYTGMLGHALDWVSLSAPGSAEGTYVYWTFTGGGVSGSKAFTNVAAGNYVARCHFQNESTVRASSPQITVTP